MITGFLSPSQMPQNLRLGYKCPEANVLSIVSETDVEDGVGETGRPRPLKDPGFLP